MTTRLAYDGQSLIAEYDGSGNVLRRYVHGPSVDEPIVWYEGSGTSDRRWHHPDERGSIAAFSNGSGISITYNSYDEFGIPQSTNIGRFQYTGQQWLAELGMYHYRARIYSPTLGRFLQTDPIGYGVGMNMYAYVGNDPVNLIDPMGLRQVCGTATVEQDFFVAGFIAGRGNAPKCVEQDNRDLLPPITDSPSGPGRGTPQPGDNTVDCLAVVATSEGGTTHCRGPGQESSSDPDNNNEDPDETEEEREQHCESARNFSDVTLAGAAGAFGLRFLRVTPVVGTIIAGELLAFNLLNRVTIEVHGCNE